MKNKKKIDEEILFQIYSTLLIFQYSYFPRSKNNSTAKS